MSFAWVLILFIGGDPLPWAGFNDKDACELVRKGLTMPKGVTALCAETKQTSTNNP